MHFLYVILLNYAIELGFLIVLFNIDRKQIKFCLIRTLLVLCFFFFFKLNFDLMISRVNKQHVFKNLRQSFE